MILLDIGNQFCTEPVHKTFWSLIFMFQASKLNLHDQLLNLHDATVHAKVIVWHVAILPLVISPPFLATITTMTRKNAGNRAQGNKRTKRLNFISFRRDYASDWNFSRSCRARGTAAPRFANLLIVLRACLLPWPPDGLSLC